MSFILTEYDCNLIKVQKSDPDQAVLWEDAQRFLDVNSLYSELDICSLTHKFTLQLQLFTIEYC